MPVLQVNDQRHQLQPGQTRLGAGDGVDVPVSGDPSLGIQAIVDVGKDGRVVIRRAADQASVRVNGVALGVEPTPLLHGDKVEIAGCELLFADDAKVGATQFVTTSNVAEFMHRRAGAPRATTATGGRLVSLVDGKEYTIPAAGVIIGRDAACDVVVPQNDVSRQHASIAPEERGYVLQDRSANGVFVNGSRVEDSVLLARADVVRIGTEEFRFYADVAPQAARPGAPDSSPRPAAAVERTNVSPPPAALLSTPPPPPPPAAREAPPAIAARAASEAVGSATSLATEPSPVRLSDNRPVLATLEIINEGVDKGRRIDIRTPLAHVGRGEHNEVVLANDSVSDSHAKLMFRDGAWYLADVGSTNGTYLSGTRVTGERRLDGTPDVRFGGVKVIFRAGSTAAEPLKGTRAIASVPVDRAARAADVPSAAASGSPERRTSPWIWLLILAAVVVVALLLLYR
jgi:pSer/pThr/pTyr-binding forkhead associated (FHA) protein